MQKPNWPQNPQTRETIHIPSTSSHLKQPQPNDLKYMHNVEVKGTFTGSKPKTFQIQPNQNKFIVYSSQSNLQNAKTKQFPLNELTIKHKPRQNQGKSDYLKIETNTGKKYAVNSQQSLNIIDEIHQGQTAYQINKYQFREQPIIHIPKQVNYVSPLTTNQFQRQVLPPNTIIFTQPYPLLPTLQAYHFQPQKQDFSHYPRRKFYLNPQDWKVDKDKGVVAFINEEKRANQKKVITWVIKKFLTTGSFNGISYPTFVMKPQSILQTYAHAIGAVPWLFENITNPVQRMKKFVCLIQTFSLLCCDTTKPFNPPLGQTFQAKIANGNYYAQQIVHHPPVSAFFYEGKGFKLSGCFEMTASIGPNSAKGSFNGDLKMYFDDGVTYIGRIPCGEFSGFLFGQEKFETYGTFYAYNTKRLVFSGNTPQKRNFFQGYIGKLKPKQQQEFFKLVHSSERFAKFPFYDRHSFDTVFSSMEMNYGYNMVFDQKEYFNTQDHKYLPFVAEPIPDKRPLLKSDSRFRKDIPLRAQMKFEEAQAEKEKLEQEERYFRKLRAKYDPIHHPHS